MDKRESGGASGRTELLPAIRHELVQLSMLIDSVKQEWSSGGHWSEWDQQRKDALSALIARIDAEAPAPDPQLAEARAEGFKEGVEAAAKALQDRAERLRTKEGRRAAEWHEYDAGMVARELDRQGMGIIYFTPSPFSASFARETKG